MREYRVAVMTLEDMAIFGNVAERVRATYKAMDCNDVARMDWWRADRELGVTAQHSALADRAEDYLQGSVI